MKHILLTALLAFPIGPTATLRCHLDFFVIVERDGFFWRDVLPLKVEIAIANERDRLRVCSAGHQTQYYQ